MSAMATLATAMLYAAGAAAQPTEFWDAYRFSVVGGPASRTLNLCSNIGNGLPQTFDRFYTSQDNAITLDLRVHLDQGDANHFVAIPDIGGGQWVTQDYTNLEVKGLSIDIAVALSVLTYLDRVKEPSSNVVDVTMCRPGLSSAIPASCASLRNFITNDPGSDLIEIAPCLSSPTLDPADDLGDLSGDDVTPVLAPLLHVQTAAGTVNWFLDGVLVGSSNASGGVASFRFPTVSTEGVHSYAAQHGTGGPVSAPLYLTIQIDALFRDAFEVKTRFPLPLG